jgi:HD-GYP domain-containing protein (c-di-GMP phosphodiesterase class II)
MSATATSLQRSEGSRTSFTAVQIDVLQWTGAVAVDLFVHHGDGEAPILFRRAGMPILARQLAELKEAGLEHLHVRSVDFATLSSDVLESLEATLQQDGMSGAHRFAAMQLAVAVEVEQALRSVDCGKFVALAERMGSSLADLMGTSKVLPSELFRIARHDFHTFAHVTNVACYSVLLADRMGIRDATELRQIATGAMLHDLGKRAIPKNVLAKPGRLTPEERELMQSHTQRGYEELCERPDLVFGQLMMVYQHHEHIDGNGYPVRILGDEIHPWAKLLAVVDVFDALTGKRPYRRSVSTQAALDHLRSKSGKQFDREVVECWMAAMQQA